MTNINPESSIILKRSTNLLIGQRGFTLIEVVLVLAIGGLIFLLAFLAFGQASKNRRDTQRKRDIAQMLSLAETYASSSAGHYPCYESPTSRCNNATPPASWTNFEDQYLNDLKDPSGHDYAIYAYNQNWNSGGSEYFLTHTPYNGWPYTVVYALGAICNGSSLKPESDNSASHLAIWIRLESGAGHCVSNV